MINFKLTAYLRFDSLNTTSAFAQHFAELMPMAAQAAIEDSTSTRSEINLGKTTMEKCEDFIPNRPTPSDAHAGENMKEVLRTENFTISATNQDLQ